MNKQELAELERLADEIILDEDPCALAEHIADSIEAWIAISGCSTRDSMWLKTEVKFWRKEADK